MAIDAKASRAGPVQSGTATTGKVANRTGPEQSAMTSAEKGNDKNVSDAVSEVFQKIQNDIILLNMPLVPTKTSLEEGRWSEAQECMRAMEQRFSECVRAVEMQLSSETQERCLQLLDLQSRVCERWEADRFERDINILVKVFNAKKLLQRQAKQGEAMQATLQQSLTAQHAQPLQIQRDGASTTEQEMRVSYGTGLLDLKHSTRCLQLSSDFDTSAQRQQQPHTRTQQSMQNRHNSSRKEESERQQGVKTVHQQLPSSPVCFKSNTLLPCLLKLFFQKAYGKGWVSVWGYVLYRCAYANSLCRKLFEKGGGLLSVFHSAIMSTDYQLDSIVVTKW
jgi:hypothetical protein